MKSTRNRYILTTLCVALLLAVSCGTKPPSVPSTPTNSSPSQTAVVPTSLPAQTAPVNVTPTAAQTSVAPATAPTVPADAAALVNGQAIPLQDFENQVTSAMSYLKQQSNFDASTQEGQAAIAQLRRQVLGWLVDQVLIEQAATQENISIEDAKVEAEITRLTGDDPAKFEEWLKSNNLTRDSFKVQLQHELLGNAVQEHIVGALPAMVEQVHARHILVASEAEAMDILIKLRSGTPFADLAKQFSQDKGSNEMGGDLGFFPRGVMPTAIEATAFALAPGQVSGIVKSDFGYHIIEVIEKDPARQVPDEMVAAWRQKTFAQWLDTQRSAAKIQYLVPME